MAKKLAPKEIQVKKPEDKKVPAALPQIRIPGTYLQQLAYDHLVEQVLTVRILR